MAGWKRWVKSGLLAWQRRKYNRLLEKKTMVYDSWIKQVEAEKYGDGCGEGAVSVHQIPYEACRDYLTKGAMEADRADVALFVGENGKISEIAEKVVAEYFTRNKGIDIAYGDEDVMGPDGVRYTPWFKPDWSPDTFLSFFYFGNVFAVRMGALRALTEEEMKWIWQPEKGDKDNGGVGNGRSRGETGIYRLCYVLAVKCGGFLVRNGDGSVQESGNVNGKRNGDKQRDGSAAGQKNGDKLGTGNKKDSSDRKQKEGKQQDKNGDGSEKRNKNCIREEEETSGNENGSRELNGEKASGKGIRFGFPIGHMDEVLFHGKENCEISLVHSRPLGWAGCPSDGTDNRTDVNDGYEEKISIVIPSKDNAEVLKRCIQAVQAQYGKREKALDCEIIVVDNGSAEEVREDLAKWFARQGEGIQYLYLYREMPFHFSQMCNIGAEAATGDVLLFLNDDVEMWAEGDSCLLELLYGRARRSFTGAVGVKLYYPGSRRVQHAGVVNLRLGPVHKLQFKEDGIDYFYGWNRRERNVAAVTGACLAVEKKKYREAGGFPEELPVAFNDVDFCFTLFEKGYYNVVLQDTVLYHYESMSRGNDDGRDKLERLLGEKDRLYARHPQMYGRDPFYHKYLAGDMLSTGFELKADYNEEPQMAWGKIREEKGLAENAREDACVIVSLEYAGTFRDFQPGGETVTEPEPAKGKNGGKGNLMAETLKIGRRMVSGMETAARKKAVVRKEAAVRKKTDIACRKRAAYLLQGYSFVTGSDNARYEKYLLFRLDSGAGSRDSCCVFSVKAEPFVRKDVEGNLPDQANVGMTGFCILIGTGDLPPGVYQIGVMVKDKCSGQKLYTWTNRYLADMGKPG